MLHSPSSFEVSKPSLAGISRCVQEHSSTPGELRRLAITTYPAFVRCSRYCKGRRRQIGQVILARRLTFFHPLQEGRLIAAVMDELRIVDRRQRLKKGSPDLLLLRQRIRPECVVHVGITTLDAQANQ